MRDGQPAIQRAGEEAAAGYYSEADSDGLIDSPC